MAGDLPRPDPPVGGVGQTWVMTDEQIAQRAKELAQNGRNTIQGLVGTLPDSATRLRATYLTWCEEAEHLLAAASVEAGEIAALQSERHRDIVKGDVPDDQLWREISQERDHRLRLLDRLSHATVDGQDQLSNDAETLIGRRGETYLWFPGRVLGRGGYSIVYEGETVDNRPLAIKRVEIREDRTSRWYADARLAERELDVAQRLPEAASDYLMPVLDDFLGESELFLIMPRADRSLDDVLKAGERLSEPDVRDLLMRAAEALRVLSTHGIVHRDIKPSNVYWWRGHWVLGDLGIAHINGATGTYTWAGTGTHRYWAPELFNFEPATVQSDLYALGCTAVEALTGTLLFHSEDLARQHREQPPHLPTITDPVLERVLTMLLKKDRQARPSDARHLEELLTPADTLTEDQVLLQQMVAASERRAAVAEGQAAHKLQLKEHRRASIVVFQRLWDELFTHASAAVPGGVEQVVRDEQWFLNVADGQLMAQLREPASGQCSALMLGFVQLAQLDGAKSVVANLICELKDDLPHWDLAIFTHDDLFDYKPQLGRGRSDTKGGMSMGALEEVVDWPTVPGPPRISIDRREATAKALFGLFVQELKAFTDPT